jgi:hypothetical protein
MVPSGIDKEKLFLQLDRLKEVLSQLETIRKGCENEKILLPAIERLLQIAIGMY